MTPFMKKAIAGGVALVAAIIAVMMLWNGMFVQNSAGSIMIIQSWYSGKLTVVQTPGLQNTMFGKVTTYRKRDQVWFTNLPDANGVAAATDPAMRIRFNDGAHAHILGSISWEMPSDEKSILALHAAYNSHDGVESALLKTVVDKSIYTSGPLMSSQESYAERRNELLSIIDDQIKNGVFETEIVPTTTTDPLTNARKSVNIVKLKLSADGKPMVAVSSPLIDFNVRTFNLSVNQIKYETRVEEQIGKQQEATMAVQIAIATSKEAEQRALTVAKQGEANAAEARWKQEVLKATAVTLAQQEAEVAKTNADREATVARTNAAREAEVQKTNAQRDLTVAQLNVQTAEQVKQAAILKGEGEATARQLIINADGALAQKLDAWVKSQQAWATAFGGYKGNLVPQVVTGGGTGGGTVTAGSSANDLLSLMAVKAAKDLSLDMTISGAPAPAPTVAAPRQ